MPKASFSIELWVTDHVYRRVAVVASILEDSENDRRLSFGYNSGTAFWNVSEGNGFELAIEGLAR